MKVLNLDNEYLIFNIDRIKCYAGTYNVSYLYKEDLKKIAKEFDVNIKELLNKKSDIDFDKLEKILWDYLIEIEGWYDNYYEMKKEKEYINSLIKNKEIIFYDPDNREFFEMDSFNFDEIAFDYKNDIYYLYDKSDYSYRANIIEYIEFIGETNKYKYYLVDNNVYELELEDEFKEIYKIKKIFIL